MVETNKIKNEDDYFPLEFRHPIHALGSLLWDLTNSLGRLEETFDEGAAKTLRKKIPVRDFPYKMNVKKDTTKTGIWTEEFVKAKQIAELSLMAATGCGKWTRWGLGARAGEFETTLRRDLRDVVECLEMVAEKPSLFAERMKSLKENLERIWDQHSELVDCAIDSEDHAVDDWIAVLTLLKQRLATWIEAHRALVEIIVKEGRKNVGDWMYEYMAAGSDTEELLRHVGPQLYRTREFEEFESWMNLPALCASGRCSFLVKLGVFHDSFEEIDLVHEELPRRAGRLLREVDLTLADYPGPNQSKVTWALWLTKDYGCKPVWDDQARELKLAGLVCKRYRRKAPNQTTILNAFQEENWSRRIYAPLKGQQLKETVSDLNKDLRGLRFHSDGDGVYWKTA